MDNKTLLAFLLILQDTDINLTNHPALEPLRDKLDVLSRKAEITPKNWENLQSKLAGILKNDAALNQRYQEAMAQLEGIEITADLLPTVAELEQATPSNSKVKTLGFKPGTPERESENLEIINNAVVVKTAAAILKSENPAETAKTLLQRFREVFKLEYQS
jgi:hypothetical protein